MALRSYSVMLLVTGLLQITVAQDSQNSTADQPKQEFVGWVALPDGRGTFDILTSCLLTIVACTWSVLHLNLPDQQDSSLKKLLRKLKWTTVTVLFPEFILAHASSEQQVAIDNLNEMRAEETCQSQAELEKLEGANLLSAGRWTAESEIFWEDWLLRPA